MSEGLEEAGEDAIEEDDDDDDKVDLGIFRDTTTLFAVDEM